MEEMMMLVMKAMMKQATTPNERAASGSVWRRLIMIIMIMNVIIDHEYDYHDYQDT